jgi:hypothetical protein
MKQRLKVSNRAQADVDKIKACIRRPSKLKTRPAEPRKRAWLQTGYWNRMGL